MRLPRFLSVLVLSALLSSCCGLTGCVAAGVTSGGHFFIFPSLGVIVLIIVVVLLMRRR